uniref:Uncharacterized protein n=1 Tax=Arundo donax TaxID=35708 RepID=A0A0A8YKB7_ARUDO
MDITFAPHISHCSSIFKELQRTSTDKLPYQLGHC